MLDPVDARGMHSTPPLGGLLRHHCIRNCGIMLSLYAGGEATQYIS